MKSLLCKYEGKLVAAGLADAGAPLLGGLDAELVWNREHPQRELLAEVFDTLGVAALLYCQPAEPYRSILEFLAETCDVCITPGDCETRTFLHDLPVVDELSAASVASALQLRKGVIVPGPAVVAFGTVSPEQAFVTMSSVCFAGFVKFFSDLLADTRTGTVTTKQRELLAKTLPLLDPLPTWPPPLMAGPFTNTADIHAAICEVGRATVTHRLVDSFFGNISYLHDGVLHISQTGSSLDETEGLIDPVPLAGGSCAGITASSELTAHREVVEQTGHSAVLHGHPKFSVILSLDCDKPDCELRGECHRRCPEERFIDDIPVVPGEVGTGEWGLCNTLPPALVGRRGAIVYGHGVFTVGQDDFAPAFRELLAIESLCRAEVLRRLG